MHAWNSIQYLSNVYQLFFKIIHRWIFLSVAESWFFNRIMITFWNEYWSIIHIEAHQIARLKCKWKLLLARIIMTTVISITVKLCVKCYPRIFNWLYDCNLTLINYCNTTDIFYWRKLTIISFINFWKFIINIYDTSLICISRPIHYFTNISNNFKLFKFCFSIWSCYEYIFLIY